MFILLGNFKFFGVRSFPSYPLNWKTSDTFDRVRFSTQRNDLEVRHPQSELQLNLSEQGRESITNPTPHMVSLWTNFRSDWWKASASTSAPVFLPGFRTSRYDSGTSGGSGGGAAPPPPTRYLCLDQTEARRAEKMFFGDGAPPLSQGLDDPPPPPLSEGLDTLLRTITYKKSRKPIIDSLLFPVHQS